MKDNSLGTEAHLLRLAKLIVLKQLTDMLYDEQYKQLSKHGFENILGAVTAISKSDEQKLWNNKAFMHVLHAVHEALAYDPAKRDKT